MIAAREMYNWQSINRNCPSSTELNIRERYGQNIVMKVKADKYKQ